MKKLAMMTAAVGAAAGLWVGLTLPARRASLAPVADGSVAGAFHIHTNRSDGRSSPVEIAAAAARAGLSFIVLTDHGDATRRPDPPTYYGGVLCLDGVEISTEGGHLIALDMPPAPEAIWGSAQSVAERVKRLGGFIIAAHPDSPKAALRWQAWEAPFDAVEWINPDSSWRVHAQDGWSGRWKLLAGLLHYPMRPSETMTSLLTDSEDTFRRWTAVADRRRIVGLAGVDAHAKLELRDAAAGDNRYSLPLPSYEALFRTLSVHLLPDSPLTGNAAADGRALMNAIRAGHAYVVVDGIATPASFSFTARNATGGARAGDELSVGGPLALTVRSNAPAGFATLVWHDDTVLVTEQRSEFTFVAPEDVGVYRVEIRAPDGESPPGRTWLLGNPIYVRSRS